MKRVFLMICCAIFALSNIEAQSFLEKAASKLKKAKQTLEQSDKHVKKAKDNVENVKEVTSQSSSSNAGQDTQAIGETIQQPQEKSQKKKDEYTRELPTEKIEAESFYNREIPPVEHAGWDASTSIVKLKERLQFLFIKQVEFLNAGNWDSVAASYHTRGSEIFKVIQALEKKNYEVFYELHILSQLYIEQQKLLYPGLNIEKECFNNIYNIGKYDYDFHKMSKYRYYDILNYYIEMAKREETDLLRSVSTGEAVYWRSEGILHPEMFTEDQIFADDDQLIAADKELIKLCESSGLNKPQTFEEITSYRQAQEAAAWAELAEENTKMVPKTSLNDPNAVAFIKKEFKDYYYYKEENFEVVKVFIKSKWENRVNEFGVLIFRVKFAAVIAKHPNGTYYLYNCRMESKTLDGGSTWYEPTFHISDRDKPGYIINWK